MSESNLCKHNRYSEYCRDCHPVVFEKQIKAEKSKLEKEVLFRFIENYDDDDLPDGAWWAALESGVNDFNRQNKTDYDPFDMVHEYLEWV